MTDISRDDEKMLWRAYRLGTLPKNWRARPDMTAAEFVDELERFMLQSYQHGWSVRRDGEPELVLFGISAAGVVVLGDAVWSHNVSPRGKVELMAALFEVIRKEMVAIFLSEYRFKRFYEFLADIGLLRRVGTVYWPDEKMVEFQTRT